MINIGIHTEAQDSGKSYTAINLALSLTRLGHSVILVDADDSNNNADTSKSILDRKPLRDRGFKYFDLEEWKGADNESDYVIFDTSRNPTNGIKSALKTDCDIVLIPCVNNEKSMQAAEDALHSMIDSGVRCAIIPNRKNDADTASIRREFKRAHATITSDLPNDTLSVLLDSGDLLTDAPANEKENAELTLSRHERLAQEIIGLIQ